MLLTRIMFLFIYTNDCHLSSLNRYTNLFNELITHNVYVSLFNQALLLDKRKITKSYDVEFYANIISNELLLVSYSILVCDCCTDSETASVLLYLLHKDV